jgi:hypothetical protein
MANNPASTSATSKMASLRVTIKKGVQRGPSTVCDDQFYDTSGLVVLVQLP